MTAKTETDHRDIFSMVERAAQVSLEVLPLRLEKDSLVLGHPESLSPEELEQLRSRLDKIVDFPYALTPVEDELLADFLEADTAEYNTAELAAKFSTVDPNAEGAVASLVEKILSSAVRLRASDVHIEPAVDSLRIRIRVDGLLEELVQLPAALTGPLVSRLKVQARMNIVERRRPQDGQFSAKIGVYELDVRIATIATLYGEKAELRLLYTTRAVQDLSGLGMAPKAFERYQKMIDTQNGLIIAAGPTGSGKTTTLQSTMRVLNTPDRNVSTIEDPVEYIVPGINHIPVIEEIGVGFAEQLRALLRQDPDVILVGESRDSETARISFHAAMAGRLVLTSIHASDAVSSIHRLFQMDVEPHLVAAALRGVVAQRLVRRNCKYCTIAYKASTAEKILLNLESSSVLTLHKGLGCTICRGSGYMDRVGVYQILPISDRMRELISQRSDLAKLTEQAAKEGLIPLVAEAYDMAIRGITTVEEVSRMAGADV